MNERAVTVLVKAALDGVTQLHNGGMAYRREDAMCAGGVLLDALLKRLGRPWQSVGRGCFPQTLSIDEVYSEYGMTPWSWCQMIAMNDRDRADFLAIARKLGPSA